MALTQKKIKIKGKVNSVKLSDFDNLETKRLHPKKSIFQKIIYEMELEFLIK